MPESTIDPDAFHDGEAAARELTEALALAGFKLPSLRGDYPVGRSAHVQLGGASGEMVRRLAAWIRERATGSASVPE
jgi:hypothetical protein